MQQQTAVAGVIDLDAARVAGREFTHDELCGLESCRLFLGRSDDPKNIEFIESDEGEQIAVFTRGEEGGVISIAKSRGQFIALDADGKLITRGKSLREVIVKTFTGRTLDQRQQQGG